MPFDSFMTAALTNELSKKLVGLKVDRVFQPERDEIDLLFHISGRNRLMINCTAATPFMALSEKNRENPAVPPMMCMLLRKHLSRAKITAVEQIGFDRIIRISFDSGDEMGYRKSKYLYCEMMGRGSNLIFVDEDGTILAAFRQNDITTKFQRVIMTGLPYEAMPLQDKMNPFCCEKEDFIQVLRSASSDLRADLFLQKMFYGFGKLTAREVVFLACGDPEKEVSSLDPETFWNAFSSVIYQVKTGDFAPCLIYESLQAKEEGQSPFDFSFMRIRQFSHPFYVCDCSSISEAIETFYFSRDLAERKKQHHNDISQILKNCKNRLEKKIQAQMLQLEEASLAEEEKKKGDLIMQEIYRIHRGDISLEAIDYSMDPPITITIPLDGKISPSQNAQNYYREYAKKKNALRKVAEQIELAKKELEYARSIEATLETAITSADLQEIRQELSGWSYGRRLVSGLKKSQSKTAKVKPREIKTKNGFLIYIGMNNFQNDIVSSVLAQKEDLWFHVKNYHGSHVLLKHRQDLPFSEEDMELAASLAAFYSEVGKSDRVEVDYTSVRFIKKPNGSKPGFITYKNHKTAIVTPRGIN